MTDVILCHWELCGFIFSTICSRQWKINKIGHEHIPVFFSNQHENYVCAVKFCCRSAWGTPFVRPLSLLSCWQTDTQGTVVLTELLNAGWSRSGLKGRRELHVRSNIPVWKSKYIVYSLGIIFSCGLIEIWYLHLQYCIQIHHYLALLDGWMRYTDYISKINVVRISSGFLKIMRTFYYLETKVSTRKTKCLRFCTSSKSEI